ncbi:Superoxide dismutase, partial [Dipsacomyces acuminosporus]
MLKNIATLILAATAAANAGLIPGEHKAPDTRSPAVAEYRSSSISATIKFTEPKKDCNQVGVELSVKGLKPGVSYPYHIHINPVPANGNCTATGGHFDPYNINVGAKPYKCDPKNPAKTCELGDLAGRHGNIV